MCPACRVRGCGVRAHLDSALKWEGLERESARAREGPRDLYKVWQLRNFGFDLWLKTGVGGGGSRSGFTCRRSCLTMGAGRNSLYASMAGTCGRAAYSNPTLTLLSIVSCCVFLKCSFLLLSKTKTNTPFPFVCLLAGAMCCARGVGSGALGFASRKCTPSP